MKNEQLNFDIEKTLAPIIYDTVTDKLTNSKDKIVKKPLI